MIKSCSLLTLFFLLLTFTIKLKFATASDGVLDIDGNILNVTSEYSILHTTGIGYAVTVARHGEKNQLAVVLSTKDLPVTFTDANKEKVILEDDIVSINFTNIPEYNSSSSWIVVYEESTQLWYIGVGTAKDYPGQKTKMRTFKIESVGIYYKFVFCSDTKNSSCENVGVDYKHGRLFRLVINGGQLLISFKKHNK